MTCAGGLTCRWQVDQAGGARRLTDTYRNDVGALDASMVASAAIAKAVKTPNMGGAKYATDAGLATGRVASGAHGHTGYVVELTGALHAAHKTQWQQEHACLREGCGSKHGQLETVASACCQLQEAIARVSTKHNCANSSFSSNPATYCCIFLHLMWAVCHGYCLVCCHFRWQVDMATGARRLSSNRDRSGVGSLDATLAASDAISKAVKTPSMGSAKFATDAGIKTQRVGGMAHSG
jgi:hypothetical protein